MFAINLELIYIDELVWRFIIFWPSSRSKTNYFYWRWWIVLFIYLKISESELLHFIALMCVDYRFGILIYWSTHILELDRYNLMGRLIRLPILNYIREKSVIKLVSNVEFMIMFKNLVMWNFRFIRLKILTVVWIIWNEAVNFGFFIWNY